MIHRINDAAAIALLALGGVTMIDATFAGDKFKGTMLGLTAIVTAAVLWLS